MWCIVHDEQTYLSSPSEPRLVKGMTTSEIAPFVRRCWRVDAKVTLPWQDEIARLNLDFSQSLVFAYETRLDCKTLSLLRS